VSGASSAGASVDEPSAEEITSPAPRRVVCWIITTARTTAAAGPITADRFHHGRALGVLGIDVAFDSPVHDGRGIARSTGHPAATRRIAAPASGSVVRIIRRP